MRVSDTLNVKAIITGTAWPDFDSVVQALIGRLVAAGSLRPDLEDQAISAIRSRERMASTAMVDIGVQIPHTRLEGVDRVVSAWAVSRRAVYGEPGTPIYIVALALSPPALTGDHLNFLSALSLLLHSESARLALRNAPDAQTVYDLIRTGERSDF